MSCSTMYLYFIVSYFTFTFTLYAFPVVRSLTVIVTLLVFALIFVILDALYVTAFLPDALTVALAS